MPAPFAGALEPAWLCPPDGGVLRGQIYATKKDRKGG